MPTPPIIHQFWDKPTPPDDVAERMRSWRSNHPGWDYRLWNDDSAADFLAERFDEEAVQCFRAAKLPAMRSDIIRLGLLAGEGGLYVDADMISKAPVGDLANCDCAIRAKPGGKTGATKLANNFMLAAPGSPLFARAFATVLRNVRGGQFNLQVSHLTGPIMMTRVWRRQLNEAERESVHLIADREFRDLIRLDGGLDYRKKGAHWVEEIRQRQIIDFGRGRASRKKRRPPG